MQRTASTIRSVSTCSTSSSTLVATRLPPTIRTTSRRTSPLRLKSSSVFHLRTSMPVATTWQTSGCTTPDAPHGTSQVGLLVVASCSHSSSTSTRRATHATPTLGSAVHSTTSTDSPSISTANSSTTPRSCTASTTLAATQWRATVCRSLRFSAATSEQATTTLLTTAMPTC